MHSKLVFPPSGGTIVEASNGQRFRVVDPVTLGFEPPGRPPSFTEHGEATRNAPPIWQQPAPSLFPELEQLPHGTERGYRRGCKCRSCCSAHARKAREFEAAKRLKLAPPGGGSNVHSKIAGLDPRRSL